MKKIILFFVMFCPFLALAQSDHVANEMRSDSSSFYAIEFDLSKVELIIDPEAMKYADRFHEAYSKPYIAIRVDKTHQLKPGYPKAWLEKVETFIQYIPEEKRIEFWQVIAMPVSIIMLISCLALMAAGLILMPFFNDDVTPYFIAFLFIICAIISLIGAFIMGFIITFILIFLSLISMAVTSEMSDRDNEEEGVKFYIAWIINVLLLGAAITFFILGK